MDCSGDRPTRSDNGLGLGAEEKTRAVGLDRGCCLDPEWIERHGRLREMAGCGGVVDQQGGAVACCGWAAAENKEGGWAEI